MRMGRAGGNRQRGTLDKAAGRAALRLSVRKEDVLAMLSEEGISNPEFLAFGRTFFKDHPSSTMAEFRLAWRNWKRREGAGG